MAMTLIHQLYSKFIITFLCLIGGHISAQESAILTPLKKKTIDSLITTFMASDQVPGATLAIRIKDEFWQQGYGMADVENYVPATTSTVYRLASVSKPITSVAIMQLVESGKINLDVPIQTYLNFFPKKKYPITTRQLLGHLSGIRHYKEDEGESTRQYKNLSEALSIFSQDSLIHKPEEQLTYSTYGYTLLGVLIEIVSGMSFCDYLTEKIFKPAGMTHTYADEITTIIIGRARGYGLTKEGKLRNATLMNSSYKVPGGGLVSTAEDMINFMVALQAGKLLKSTSLKEMTTSLKLLSGKESGYGYGWIIGLDGYPNAFWHGGVQQGSTTIIVMIPSKQCILVLLTNMEEIGQSIVTKSTQLITLLMEG